MLYLLAASVLVMLASLAGVISVFRYFGPFIERNLSILVSFAAGVFLLVSYVLGVEALEAAPSYEAGLVWILAGAVGIFLIFRFVPGFHHHHDTHAERHAHSVLDARRIILSDGIHNIGDGILLAAAFAVSGTFGMLAALSVLLHELVQELSEFFVLRQAGYSVRKALTINFIVSSTILIGALGGFFLLDTFAQLEGPLLGIAAGALFVVVFHDLIPHSIRASRAGAQYGRHILWFVLGAILMIGITGSVGHTHDDGHHDHHAGDHYDDEYLHGHHDDDNGHAHDDEHAHDDHHD